MSKPILKGEVSIMIMNDNLTRDAEEKLCEFSKNNLNLSDVIVVIGYV